MKKTNIFPVLIYTAVDVLCSRECLNITFLQVSIFRCYFLKHIYISSKSVSTLQITVKPVYKGHSNEPEQYGLYVQLFFIYRLTLYAIFINGKYVTALNRQCFVISRCPLTVLTVYLFTRWVPCGCFFCICIFIVMSDTMMTVFVRLLNPQFVFLLITMNLEITCYTPNNIRKKKKLNVGV